MAAPDLLELFLRLAAIASPPGEERPVADEVVAYLTGLGLEVDEDDSAARLGGTAGNLFCRLPGRSAAGGVPVLFCAHLDTVPPNGPIEPLVENGIVRTAGGTILGADNKAAVVVMLDAVRRIVQEGHPHGGVELLFTPMEETGLFGADAFAIDQLEAEVGYVYDQAAPIGGVILAAPSQVTINARFHGSPAHAGMYAEEGRSAILAAARAIADMRLGQVDADTTANVGLISGGSALNIVPEWCSFDAEIRSHDRARLTELVQESLDTMAFAAAVSDCTLETAVDHAYAGYAFAEGDLAIRLAIAGLERAGFAATTGRSGGAADANVFNQKGLPCVNLANGMAEIHTPDEHIAVADLERMVDVTLGIVHAALAEPLAA